MKKIDVITFGESLALFTPVRTIPLEYEHQFYKQMAGAESNVAIGLRRLGHQVGWFSVLGKDPFGQSIYKTLNSEQVDTSRCLFTDEAPTGIFFKEKRNAENTQVYYYRKNSAASMLKAEDLDEEYIASASILHLTGITPALSSSCKEAVFAAIEIAHSHGVKVSFDPNIRFKLWTKEEAKPVLQDLMAKADILLPGVDEGAFLTNEKTPEKIARALLRKENQMVVMKLGAKGAYYKNSLEEGYVSPLLVKHVVDPIGAGDGFAAGVLSGILQDCPLSESVRRGNAVGAAVVGVNGDIEGLPTVEELNKLLFEISEHSDVSR